MTRRAVVLSVGGVDAPPGAAAPLTRTVRLLLGALRETQRGLGAGVPFQAQRARILAALGLRRRAYDAAIETLVALRYVRHVERRSVVVDLARAVPSAALPALRGAA